MPELVLKYADFQIFLGFEHIFKRKLDLNKKIPLPVSIRLVILINLSTNKPWFYVNTAEKCTENQQKVRFSRRVLKSHRAGFLEN